MQRETRSGILVLVAILAAGILAWVLAPAVLDRLPGRVRHYLPEPALALITTPLPAALPAPTVPAADLQGTIAALLPPMPAVTPIVATVEPEATGEAPAEASPSPRVAAPTPMVYLIPPQARIVGLPIVPQKFNNCGPTNLSIVLSAYGLDHDQFDVAAVVRPNYEDRNVSPEELRDYARDQAGLAADVVRGGDVETLKRLLALGLPVIVEKALEPDPETGWMGHYLTLYGYDDFTGHFLSRDTYLGPWEGDGRLAYGDLVQHWEPFNFTFIVVYPQDRAAEVTEALGPAFTEPARQWDRAAERARATLVAQPSNAFAWFNLGSSLVEQAKIDGQGDLWPAAAAAFDQARLLGLPPRMLWYQFGPYEAYLAVGRATDVTTLAETTLASQGGRNVEETYLYLGQAMQVQGQADAAAQAYQQVLNLHPDGPAGRAAAALLGGD